LNNEKIPKEQISLNLGSLIQLLIMLEENKREKQEKFNKFKQETEKDTG
jgi:hypothetical protein